jgi:putative flippase GtrA
VLCRVWVFDRRTISNGPLELTILAVIALVGLGLNEAIMWSAHELLHLHYLMAKAVSGAVVSLWNFSARKFLLFR